MKKQDGFPGQISFVIPQKILAWVKDNPLISDLYITDIGYYPQARYHFRERKQGCPQHILIYSVEGTGKVWINNSALQLPADHFLIIPAGMPHKYVSLTQDPWSIYWVHFSGFKAGMFGGISQRPVPIERNKLSRIGDRIELFSDFFASLERGFSHETLEYVNLGLSRLLSTFSHLNQFRIIRHMDEKDPVAITINHMLDNLNKNPGLKELSALIGISVSHYCRLFVGQTGFSPGEYFIQLKMQRACRLLDSSTLSVAEIARELGYEDQFYFSRLFKKTMGMAPMVYRGKEKG